MVAPIPRPMFFGLDGPMGPFSRYIPVHVSLSYFQCLTPTAAPIPQSMFVGPSCPFSRLSLYMFLYLTFSVLQYGEENCQELIEAHKKCMRDMGFRIWQGSQMWCLHGGCGCTCTFMHGIFNMLSVTLVSTKTTKVIDLMTLTITFMLIWLLCTSLPPGH